MNTLSSVTSDNWLKSAIKKLNQAGIGTADLDALVLLEDTLALNRALVLAHPEKLLTSSQLRHLNKQIKLRLKHIPLAYIRQQSEFYGRVFFVDKRVLEPRPESETMIELFSELQLGNNMAIADIGTGSGCIGITSKLEHPAIKVDLYDIDPVALTVARLNAKRLKAKVKIYQSDLLTPNHGPYQILLANLPYVPDKYKINTAALNEPRIAIFGGSDGLDVYRRFWQQLSSFSWQPSYVLTEALPFQHRELSSIAAKNQYKLIKTSDFIQCFMQV